MSNEEIKRSAPGTQKMLVVFIKVLIDRRRIYPRIDMEIEDGLTLVKSMIPRGDVMRWA